VQDSLAGLRQCCTTVIVAHRLSTVADADQIVVLEGGAVAEQGSHTQLLQRSGIYAAMWARQLEAGSLNQQGDMGAARAAVVGAGDMPMSGPAVSQATSRGHSICEEDDEEGQE
jgi:ABC-type sugar transport system ATPase subunit